MKRAVFIGRYQPFHVGHEWLIRQKLNRGIPCLIMIRECPDSKFDPIQVTLMIKAVFKSDNVKVMIIPDIESINYGRGVGYEVNDFGPCPIQVSGTTIRNFEEGWEQFVHHNVAELIKSWLFG